MSTPAPTTPVPEEIVAAIESGARRLHGIASRSDAVQIASEVLRLNDAARAAARSRLHSADQPQDFAAALLALADSTHQGWYPVSARPDARSLPLALSITEAGARLRSGALTATELTTLALERAAATQPRLNAFLSIHANAALARARLLDDEARAGRWRGPLHGIPLAHKDCFERAGEAMTVGSRVLDPQPGARTATALARLADAGAVDLGPLNMNEMVAGPTGRNPHFGDCCNAWDPARISGGSSSGSGVAVAAGAVFGSLGSDTGGSIRLPASVNGLFGLKPTYGRVSRAGCFPRAFTLDCVGPLARSPQDCAILLQATAGPDPADSSSARTATPDYLARLASAAAGSRVAVLESTVDLDPQVARAFDDFAALARREFAPAERVRFEGLSACNAMGDLISKVEAATLHGEWMRERPQRYSQGVYSRTEPGLHLPAVRYVEALNLRAKLLAEFVRAMDDCDVLLCPTVPVPVPLRTEVDVETPGRVFGVVAQLTTLTRPFNYLGVPVLTMPMGRDRDGMPMGVQLVGRPFGESRLLSMAETLASAIGWGGDVYPTCA